ncbi:MAG TPA: ATP-dependent Clp protease proteolytic subunit [Candidatus Limnocylindria bacterium]|nr:ATP-dependent Clp protease proteolytic subunit [Candidatus Limnocylindria bacterium]
MRVPDLGELLHAQQMRRQALDSSGVYFITQIDAAHAEDLAKTLLVMGLARAGRPEDPITLYINSGGGTVGDGLAMIEAINLARRRYGVRIDTVVLGYAYSMGAIVMQAGDTRTIGRFGTLMLHSSQWMISGEDERVFKDYQRLSAHYQEVVAQLFAARTGQRDSSWWRRYIWSGRDRFLGPDECLQLGLVDRVDEPILIDRPDFRIGPPPPPEAPATTDDSPQRPEARPPRTAPPTKSHPVAGG